MIRTTATISLVALACSALSAQVTLPRGDTKVNRAFSPVNTVYWYSWVLAAPRGVPLPADPGISGTVATNQVGYLVYADVDGTTNVESLEFRRTNDGGLTWSDPPTQLFQDANWAANETTMVAEGHHVFVATIRVGASPGLWVYASEDQGQSWVGANVSPGLGSGSLAYLLTDNQGVRYYQFAGGLRTAVSQGILHLAYEAVDTSIPGNVNEDIYYTAVTLTGGQITTVNPEVRVSTRATGNYDCDYPRIDAFGAIVAFAYQDDRLQVGNDNANQTFSKVSIAQGADLATVVETNHSNLTGGLSTPTWGGEVKIALPNVYVTMEDSRTGIDAVHMAYSNNVGSSWNTVRINQVNTDVTEHDLAAENNRVAVVFHAGTSIYARVDNLAGAGFGGGTAPEVLVSGPGTVTGSGSDSDILFAMDMRGDTLATAYEATGVNGEDAYVGVSADGGATWTELPVFQASGDVDEPDRVLTGNRDVLYSWIDNRSCGSGNGCNDTWVSGLKVPLLTDDPAASTIELDLANESANNIAFLGVSLLGTSPPFVLNNLGFSINLLIDPARPSESGIVEFRLVSASGEATFTSVTAALRSTVGTLNIDAWLAVATLGATATNPGPFLQFTDPVKL